ncbi:hypothetical protein HDU92_001856 [Lobulomyces angularis]|nr:hypothetical protein HDU92_001856 [Lobulomyces angularis]
MLNIPILQGIPRETNLKTLEKIHSRLITNKPYDNLSVYYGNYVPTIKFDPLLKKMLSSRGGVCVELNYFYKFILEDYGFTVELKVSKVIRGQVDDKDPHANTVNTHVVLLASWKDSEKYLCDLGFADESPQLPILLREDEECLGFGGFKFKLKKGLWLNEKVWFFKIQYLNQKEMVKLDEFKHGYLFYEHLNKDDLYFEEMLSFVNTPTTVPPAKFTEYVSLALKNGGRKSILGRGDDYTYFFRDVNGTELEKLKINSNQEFRNCLKLHFNIDLNDLGSLINYTHKNLIEKQVIEK